MLTASFKNQYENNDHDFSLLRKIPLMDKKVS